ncbi:MAG: hypothetical protein QM619_05010 [Micropruina sp.]|uniref:ABC transporter permease n=1 Tax=Micropruina sp. TaxID=2737536 RepID=UPI0039E4A282
MSRGWKRIHRLVREAIAMAWAQRVPTVIAMVLMGGMTAAVLLTSGRASAAEAQILTSIDAVGSRAITIRAEPSAGLDYSVVERLRTIAGVEWVGAFGQAVDVSNGITGSDVAVASRVLVSTSLQPLGIAAPAVDGVAYASKRALDALGMPDAAGYLAALERTGYDMGGRLQTPEFLEALEPIVIVPRDLHQVAATMRPGDVALVIVVVQRPESVTAVADASRELVAPVDPAGVTVAAASDIARLRALVQGQLGGFSRGLTLMLTGVLAVLVGTLQFGLVMIRRKDFGRRRALGATRGLIVGLITVQTVLIACAASVLGAVIALTVLVSGREPLPPADFVAATMILTVAASGLGALAPAIVASRRDPLAELRVP